MEGTSFQPYTSLSDTEISSLELLREKHERYYDLAEALLKLSYNVFPIAKTIIHQLPPRVELTLLGQCTQVFRLFRSILILCRCGLDSEALILFRSLLETSSIYLYIAETDSDNRLMRYYHSYRISKYSGLRQLLQDFPETAANMSSTTPERLKREAEESLEYFRQKHALSREIKDDEIRFKYTLRPDIAVNELDMPELKKMWRVTYPIISRVAHGQDLIGFMKAREGESGLELQLQPTDASTDASLINSMKLTYWCMAKLNQLLRLGYEADIQALDESVNKFFSEEVL